MIGITIDITDAATPALRQIIGDVKPGGGLGTVMGRALANTLKKHFRARNVVPNKLGGKRTNFWSAVASSVQNPVVGTAEVSVAISNPAMAQKVFGGRIKPTKKKALAIPVNAKAHGNSPRLFKDLAFIPASSKIPATVGYLVEGEIHKILRGKRKGQDAVRPKKGGVMMYVLRAWVDQKADPRALPAKETMIEDVTQAAKIFLSRPQA
jgi:hypothetical protein